MTIKRNFNEHEFDNITSMANCLMLLSSGVGGGVGEGVEEPNRMFECKTCDRQFASFQALGGHRASHKKPRLGQVSSPQKPKSHECSVCGMEFSIGQALGGHMRKHKSSINEQKQEHVPTVLSLFSQTPIVKRSNSRRVLCLDLNLTPSENYFVFGNINAPVQCFL